MREDKIGVDALITRWGGGNKGTLALIKALESGQLTPRDSKTGLKVSPKSISELISALRQRLALNQ